MPDIPLLNQLPPNVQDLIVRLLLVVLALFFLIIVRQVLVWLIVRPLRALTARTSHQADDALLEASIVPARILVLAAGLFISAMILNANYQFVEHLVRSLVIIAVVLLFYRLIDIFGLSSVRLFNFTGIVIEERLIPFLRVTGKLILFAIAIVMIIQEWGYDISGLVAGIGLGGLAFSLAAQDTLSNLFGFTAIVGDSPFNVGDYIKTPDVEGTVEHVGVRSTQVRQLDQALVTIPNSKLAQSAILNWSRLSKRRVDYTLGMTYDTTSNQMRVLLDRIRLLLNGFETVEAKSIQVFFVNFGENSLDILIRCYIWKSDWAEFQYEKEKINLAIMDIVEQMKLDIAFPSRSIYIENLPDVEDPADNLVEMLTPREKAIIRGADPQNLDPDAPHGDDAPDRT